MAETDFVPLEKRAKGKSNVFKFVTLRNPETASPEEASKQFIHHPDISTSVFVTEGNDPQKKINYDNLSKIAATFNPIDSVEKVRAVNSALYDFSDWLFRNKNSVDTTVSNQIETLKVLTSEETIALWDNIFYYVIKNTSPYIREALLMLLVTDNFVKNYNKLAESDSDIKTLANASVVIPKLILSRPKKSTNESIYEVERTTAYNTVDEDALLQKLSQYQHAIEELQRVNRIYTQELSSVEIKATEAGKSPDKLEASELKGVSISTISEDTLQEQIGNPLDKDNLAKIVSLETITIVEELNLTSLKNPEKAIARIEKEMAKANTTIFDNKKLTKKIVSTGSSLIELREDTGSTAGFNKGCFPTIVDQVGIFASAISSTVDPTMASNFIRSTISGVGSSGGASEEVMADYGSMTFTISKVPRGAGYYMGLSPQNTNAHINSIKYAIRVSSRFNTTTSATHTIAQAYINGVSTGDFITVKSGDQLKIARVDTADGTKIVFNRYRPSTGLLSLIHKADDASPTSELESLLLDFAFTSADQIVHSIYFDPCGGSTDDGDGGSESSCSGVKNLGVSDYMRVEQEICCYTPGEVSHIENILQGEYKERSTRRLRRQETTTTFETENTTEKLRDTTTTDRYEMEQETSSIIQQDTAFDIGVTATSQLGPVNLTVDSGFATATATVDANAQAVSYAKEISSRALDRVVNRVREERITKVIEEFEENNIHGLDNTKNDSGHVTGIYRWVDKIYKNQVVNYGKRMTYEFMIPEPAKFHLWAMAQGENNVSIEKPEDPREHGLPNHSALTLTGSSSYEHWAAAYDAKVSPPPALFKEVGKAFNKEGASASEFGFHGSSNNDLTIPDGYVAYHASMTLNAFMRYHDDYWLSFSIGNRNTSERWDDFVASSYNTTINGNFNLSDIEGTLPVSYDMNHVYSFHANVVIRCERKPELMEQWRIDTFAKIMEAYQQKRAEYENAVAEAKAQASLGIQIQGNNPLYNRMTEKEELKKSCLNWLEVSVGNSHYGTTSPCEDVTDMPQMHTSEALACYAQKAKFFEQAFDWDIMTYLFYPYFWGQKCNWKEIYKLDDNDHIFRGFLQAGMSRVVVPVKPNYERAVIYYMETGEIWNGGEVPVPGDPLYESVLSSIDEQEPTPIGGSWETRVPTSLNILQKDSGAVIGDGLPCNCNDYEGEGTGGSALSGSPETTPQ